MIASGTFPFDADEPEPEEAPRVGDGVMLLDAHARVEYTSPNAVSALHRVGVHAQHRRHALPRARPRRDAGHDGVRSYPARVTEEIERRPRDHVLFRCIPLLEQDECPAGSCCVRDISELRRRDRLLLSKDATIREIHHRVKNNLQTISSLLAAAGPPAGLARGQGGDRGVGAADPFDRARARDPLARGGRGRARSSRSCGPSCRMVEEAFQSPDGPVRSRSTATPATAGAGGHPAGRRAHRAAAERVRPRLPARRRSSTGGQVVVSTWRNDGSSCGCG